MRASWVEAATPRRPRSSALARVVESCVAGASSDLASGDDARARVVATAVVKRGASALGAASEEFGGTAPRGLARATTARLRALGVSDAVVDECGRREERRASSDRGESTS